MKRSDITTGMVLEAHLISKTMFFDGRVPFDIIKEFTNYPDKIIWSAISREMDKGYLDCGCSIRGAWLTKKGMDILIKLNTRLWN